MAKPKILLYCNVYDTVVGQNIAYMEFFSHFGDVILVTSEMNLEFWLGIGDVLALPGGQDLLSSRYNSSPGWFSKNVNSHYEYLDEHLLKPWLETGKPIIGICRGMQTLNVVMGGTLHRHISGHVQSDKKDRSDTPEIMYTHIDGYHIHHINSYHHQCVKDIAPGFRVLGWSDYNEGDRAYNYEKNFSESFYIKDGTGKNITPRRSTNAWNMVPEIMKHVRMPYIAFQYHPEEFLCPLAMDLIEKTLDNHFNSPKYVNLNSKEEASVSKEN